MVSVDGTVVVGIDGSAGALAAVRWAVAETTECDAVLRLVFVIDVDAPSRGDCAPLAEDALRCALDVTTCQERHPRVQIATRRGRPDDVLIEESHGAAMICMGPGGHGWRTPLGATAAALAQNATCPVAIIRENRTGDDTGDAVIAVVLNDDPDNDEVVHQAMREGRLRHATVRQIDRRCASWVRRYPDVHVETVAAGISGSSHHDYSHVLPQLAVVGKSEAEHIANLVSPGCHPIIGYPDCSVLLVRGSRPPSEPPARGVGRLSRGLVQHRDDAPGMSSGESLTARGRPRSGTDAR